jgi:hypothetical protein
MKCMLVSNYNPEFIAIALADVQLLISSIKGVKKKNTSSLAGVFLTSSPPHGARLFLPSVP